MTGLYVHVPYCRSKCAYCGFNSFPVENLPEEKRYVEALLSELNQRTAPHQFFKTIYVGGGTPTALSAEIFSSLLISLRDRIESGGEWTVEANPGTLSIGHLEGMIQSGVNRISLGIQSTHDRILRSLGRIHTMAEGRAAIDSARSAGLLNISVDLIFGMQLLTLEMWLESLDEVLSWNVPHISLYDLTIEKGTEFERKGVVPVGSELSRELYEAAINRLRSAGYRHYEVSNFARPGFESRHNLSIWNGAEYLGLGAGAHSMLDRKRSWNIEDVHEYVRRVEARLSPEEGSESPTLDERAAEAMMLTLRQVEGRKIADVERNFEIDLTNRFISRFKSLSESGMMDFSNEMIRPTHEGLLHLDTLLLEFFP